VYAVRGVVNVYAARGAVSTCMQQEVVNVHAARGAV